MFVLEMSTFMLHIPILLLANNLCRLFRGMVEDVTAISADNNPVLMVLTLYSPRILSTTATRALSGVTSIECYPESVLYGLLQTPIVLHEVTFKQNSPLPITFSVDGINSKVRATILC